MTKVYFFKPSGKFYTEEDVDFSDIDHEGRVLHDVLQDALIRYFAGKPRLEDMIVLVMECDIIDRWYPIMTRIAYVGGHLDLVPVSGWGR